MFAVIAFICGVVAAILKLTNQHAATEGMFDMPEDALTMEGG